MSADHSLYHEEAHETPAPPRIGWPELGSVVVLLALVALGSQISSLAPLVVLAAAIGVLLPHRHGWKVRAALGAIAGLMMLFVVKMWVAENAEPPAEVPTEPKTLLSWLIGIPIAGCIAVLFLPRQAHRFLQGFTMIVMLVTLAVSAFLLGPDMGRTFHFNQDIVWLSRFGIHYHVALDGISLWLVLLTTFVSPIAAYASFGSVHHRIKDWCFALLLLEGALVGSFVSLDLFLFYVFFELSLVPMYVMIGVWGGQNRIKAAIKFFLYTMTGSVLMLAAMLYLVHQYAKLTGHPSFDYFELQRVVLPRGTQIWLWAAFSLAFLIKVPMFPVHTWLPDAHTEAPTAGSVILAAIMLKLGTYGYMRFSMGLFPEACSEFAANLAGVAVLGGILYGALCAWKQDDVKRLVAYSSVAHLGYVMLGLFANTPAALEGAVLQMVNHGISTGMLFLLVGVIYDRRHTRAVDEYGGIAKVMPVYTALFLVATLASIGLPGTNGFIGEFMVITGTFVSQRLGHFNGIQAVGAAIGVILGALYMLSVVQKVFFGPITKKENQSLSDVSGRELVSMVPLVIAIFTIGLFPNIFLHQIKDATSRVATDFDARVMASPPPLYYQGPPKLLPRRQEAPAVVEEKTPAKEPAKGGG
jgi:NADH-quinone oxidoreductase subunit M